MLFKNAWVTLHRKWAQLLSIGLIILLSAGIYTSMHYAVSSLEEPTLEYLEAHAQEDFSIDMQSVIQPKEQEALAQDANLPPQLYTLADLKRFDADLFEALIERRQEALLQIEPDLSLELRQILDFHFQLGDQDHRAILLKDSEKINRSFIEAGTTPRSDDEVAISRVYAQENDLQIGDELTIAGQTYRISGFVLFPDYTYGVVDQSILVDYQRLTFMLASDAVFESLPGQAKFRFAGRFVSDAARDRWPQTFGSEATGLPDFLTTATLTEHQFRSGAIFDELRGGRLFGIAFSLLIAGLAFFIVALLLGKTMHAQSAPIGLLKALGYTRSQIALPYLLVIVIWAVPMLLGGYVAGVYAADFLKDLLLEFYLLPAVSIRQRPQVLAIALLLPLFVFAGLSGLIAFRLLSRRPLDLLHPQRLAKVNRLTRVASRLMHRARAKTKFTYLYVLQNGGKFFIFFVGILFASFLLLIGLSMHGMVERMSIEPLRRTEYRYEAHVDPMQPLPSLEAGQEPFLQYPDALAAGRSISLMGLWPDGTLHRLHDEDGDDITPLLETSVVISRSLALKEGLEAGDPLVVSAGRESHEVTIGGVAEDYAADRLFLDLDRLASWLGLDGEPVVFSGIHAQSPPEDEAYAVVLSKESFMEEALRMQDFFQYSVYIIVGSAVLIAVLLLLTLSTMTIEDNHYPLSLLKVIGYSRREVHRMILQSYWLYMLVAYLVSLPLTMVSLHWIVHVFAAGYDLVFPLAFSPWHALIGGGLIGASFIAGTAYARSKIRRVPLQEMLKTYAE